MVVCRPECFFIFTAMKQQPYLIDTFTGPGLRGNPTAVYHLHDMDDEPGMQQLAATLNLPVTAFIRASKPEYYSIKYFTPTTQIPACGHATLAAAKVAQMHDSARSASFETVNGVIIKTNVVDEVIMMTYPKYELLPLLPEISLLESLKLKDYVTAGYCPQLETIFIELRSAHQLKTIQPDFLKMVTSHPTTKEVVVTAASNDENYDFLLRSFCPWIGIDEDPVTGSVHSVLAEFWGSRLNKHALKAYQASERGGEIIVRNGTSSVEIGGHSTISL